MRKREVYNSVCVCLCMCVCVSVFVCLCVFARARVCERVRVTRKEPVKSTTPFPLDLLHRLAFAFLPPPCTPLPSALVRRRPIPLLVPAPNLCLAAVRSASSLPLAAAEARSAASARSTAFERPIARAVAESGAASVREGRTRGRAAREIDERGRKKEMGKGKKRTYANRHFLYPFPSAFSSIKQNSKAYK